MVRTLVMLLCLSIPACWGSPKYETQRGIGVYCETDQECPTREALELVVGFCLTEIATRFGCAIPTTILGRLRVFFSPDPVGVTPPGYAGLIRGTVIRLHWQGSVCTSALYHELLHLVVQLQRGAIDAGHELREYWDTEGEVIRVCQEQIAL